MTYLSPSPSSLKILIVGNDNIGKSSLVMTLLMNNYDRNHVPSVVAPILISRSKYNTEYDIHIMDSKKEEIIKLLKLNNSSSSSNNNNSSNSNSNTNNTNKRTSTKTLFHPLDYIDCIIICIDSNNYMSQLNEWKNILSEIYPYGKRNSLIISIVLLKSDQCELGMADSICKELYNQEFTYFEFIGNVSCKYPDSVINYFLTLFNKIKSPISPLFTPEKAFSTSFLKALMTVYRFYDFQNQRVIESHQLNHCVPTSMFSKPILPPSIQSYSTFINRALTKKDVRYSLGLAPLSTPLAAGLFEDIIMDRLSIDCFSSTLARSGWKYLIGKLKDKRSTYNSKLTFFGLCELLYISQLNVAEMAWKMLSKRNFKFANPELEAENLLSLSEPFAESSITKDKTIIKHSNIQQSFLIIDSNFKISGRYELSADTLKFLYYLFHYPLYEVSTFLPEEGDDLPSNLFSGSRQKGSHEVLLNAFQLKSLLFPLPDFLTHDFAEISNFFPCFVENKKKLLTYEGFIAYFSFLAEIQPKLTHLRMLHLGYPYEHNTISHPLKHIKKSDIKSRISVAVISDDTTLQEAFCKKFNFTNWTMCAINCPPSSFNFNFHDFETIKFVKLVNIQNLNDKDDVLQCDLICILVQSYNSSFFKQIQSLWPLMPFLFVYVSDSVHREYAPIELQLNKNFELPLHKFAIDGNRDDLLKQMFTVSQNSNENRCNWKTNYRFALARKAATVIGGIFLTVSTAYVGKYLYSTYYNGDSNKVEDTKQHTENVGGNIFDRYIGNYFNKD